MNEPAVMNKCIFFDRDGIINKRKTDDYVLSYDEFFFEEGFFEIFKFIKERGYLAIVITNQQGIGKGLMSETDLEDIHGKMQEDIKAATGYVFDDIFFCGDLAGSGSERRKPEPGMLLEAIAKWGIDPGLSFMIGDSESDVKAANAAGVGAIFIGESPGTEALLSFKGLSEALDHFKKLLCPV